mmetsp:Transcript_15092/g.42570  ORF Transcript_15092/g.42570 Transcript_15092/m.42570 type:complete len:465 (-) Transcript_15092:76-1470(-)|eukprot:CAMPEP_0119561980 /NCGR_PEP_ID=MMETSP1352-20130426/19178_1 /TAXON_ID=265584 /ORGANISM="Stauroneis constricta, Strain CCMP1120" /LENGTH=464 /DNA_ID=CAMNT_0007610305 /DNA_START=135 /DNA_END=1529 /DNA_ORIENTATION=+
MPPNAEISRRHTTNVVDDLNDDHDDVATTTRAATRTFKNNEICIDGIIYDLTNFQHPGGDSINMFGGNDVTVQYKMIHPYHTTKHLEKLRQVGVVEGYKSEYAFDTEFEREIKAEVFKIVRRGREFGTPGYFFRVLCYVSLAFYLQYRWMMGPTSYTLATVYGVALAMIGLNVQHDANHGAASRKVWINDLLGFGADMIGGCKWLWMEKHWTHHTYTNHKDKDPDGFAAEPVVLFNDYSASSDKRSWMHPFQAFYLVIVLAGYWHSAVFNLAEVFELKDRGAQHVGMKMENDWITNRGKFALALRLTYITCNIVVPFARGGLNWDTFFHINVMGIAGSLALGLLFTLSHNFENADRDPTVEFRRTGKPVCWFKAQVETSSTYGGTVSGWLTGGLNFQVEHHLFPRMSSAWYPLIAPKIREICKKHDVKYAYYPWVWQNMISTLKYTHQIGNASHWHGNPFKGET